MMDKRCLRPLICPLCYQYLSQENKSLICPNRHTFDVAKEGYVNLLLSSKKLADSVGDSRKMLKARREFLDSGLYQPLSDQLNWITSLHLANFMDGVVVDAGCGEGYYLEQLAQTHAQQDVCYFGVDVAKEAARLAAKRKGYGRYLVADVNKFIPLADQSTHLLLNIFAPRNIAEFARVLHPAGLLIVVIPTAVHLANLRQAFNLLSIQPEKAQVLMRQMADAFSLEQKAICQFELQLTNDDLVNLIQMTPSARHLTEDMWQAIKKKPAFQTEASFEILQFSTSINT